MLSSPIFKSAAIATTMIFAGASAQAATVASVELTNGQYILGVSTVPGPPLPFVGSLPVPVGPALEISADFDAGFFPIDPLEEQDFVLSAGLTVDDDELFGGSLLVEDTTAADLLFEAFLLIDSLPPQILAILGSALDEVLDGDNGPSEVAPGVFLDFTYDLDQPFDSPTSVQGSFVATLASTADSLFVDTPFTPQGTFSAFATVETVSPVPLPASSLVLLTGMGGFAAMRRKQMAKKAA